MNVCAQCGWIGAHPNDCGDPAYHSQPAPVATEGTDGQQRTISGPPHPTPGDPPPPPTAHPMA